MAGHIARVNINQIMPKHATFTATIELTGMRRFRFRIFLVKCLLRLAGLVSPIQITVAGPNIPEQD